MENSPYHQLLQELGTVQLIAVSKSRPLDAIYKLYHMGQRHFGENRVSELWEKANQSRSSGFLDIHWHFIGHLQKNDLNRLAKVHGLYALHSVDRKSIALELIKRLPLPRLKLFLQVNLSNESSRQGFLLHETGMIEEVSQLLTPYFEVCGLMGMASPQLNLAKGQFELLKQMRDLLFPGLQLSMGMSDDYPIALQVGTDWVRVGRKLFQTEKD